jgi:hypothetical protein
MPNGTYGGVRGERKSPLLDYIYDFGEKSVSMRREALLAKRMNFFQRKLIISPPELLTFSLLSCIIIM